MCFNFILFLNFTVFSLVFGYGNTYTAVHDTNEFETKEYKPRNKLKQKIHMYMWYFTVRTLDIRYACDVQLYIQIISFFLWYIKVIILDVRVPCTPVARLNNHRACVNGIAWAPHSSCHICTAG